MDGMGRSLGGIAGVLGLGLLVVLAAPVLALVPAMVVDRGVEGPARVSAFPAALVVLDPLVWRRVRNSVAVALAVTVGSLGLGTGLGMLLGRRRFWGRRSLSWVALAPMAVSPIWLAPGVVDWIGGDSSWSWLAARSWLGQPGDDWARWLALVWVGLVGGSPLVILATLDGLRRVDPAWADAARVVGAGRRRVWLDVTWPTLRPELGQVGAAIFTWVLVEPAGPTILGLRRTLVVELADAAFRFDEPNRAATLAALVVAIAVVGRSLLRRWGGPCSGPTTPVASSRNEPRAGLRLGGIAVGLLVLWAVFALGPAVTCGRRLVAAAMGEHPPTWATARLILDATITPEATRWALNSTTTALLAVGFDLLLLVLLRKGATRGTSFSGRWIAAIPPLALAVGALAVPSLLAVWADTTGWLNLAGGLRAVRTELSPGRSPGFLLILVLAATRLPALARGTAHDDQPAPPAPTDAALLVGASAREASRVGGSRHGSLGIRPGFVAWTWASTDLGSAWILTTLDERRTLAPAALDLIGGGTGPFDSRLLGLFVVMTLIRLAGLALVVGSTRSRRGPGWTSLV